MSSDESNAENGDVVASTNSSGDRVDKPNPNDVLCGRGGNINSHQGNEQFRSFVEKRKRVYLTARFKREKRLIASSIVNEIRAMDPPGRFLARKGSMKDNSGYWYDIGDEKARDKTSQALRENAPSIRAEIETEINQQRAEMRRQETTIDPPSSSSKAANNDASYPPPPPHGHNHTNSHGPILHGQHHGHPPPPPPPHLGHSYNPMHQHHYTQQYYDYYYHYYGYGAPPPPPPPGYTSRGAPEAAPTTTPPAGYPPTTPPYWAGQANPDANASEAPTPPAATSSSRHPSHHPASLAANVATAPPLQAQSSTASGTAMYNQEEEDRRLAMALQQEENAKAFEDRNRRYGSDRKSSRSTAFCAPGYRPRLLNDSIEAPNGNTGSTPTRKKRPAMSASHLFGPPIVFSRESTNHSNSATHGPQNEGPSAPDATNTRINMDANMDDDINDGLDHNGNDNHQHHHDFSCSSLSSKGRVQFKDDSDIMSLFGEGDTRILPSNANSTGSFNRVRNIYAATNANKNNNGNHHFNPIDLDQSERNRRNQQRSLHRDDSRRDSNPQNHNDHNQNHQDSSLLSQVANHILGNFGVGGGGGADSSWSEPNNACNVSNSSNKQDHLLHHKEAVEPDMEMELGQEVIMDVRDESSSMPPPHARGSGTQIDWPSRAGCHSWIPDAIRYTTASSHIDHHDNNRDQRGNHESVHHHTNDHSLTRQTSYSRGDISPINSMDMEFSQSSNIGGRQRTSIHNGVGNDGAHTSSSLMNVFDGKNEDSSPEELLPQIHRSSLQQVPSWERSYRSRSSVSLGDMSGMNGMDSSLIRVNSHVVKDKLFGIVGKNAARPPSSSANQGGLHHPQGDNQLSMKVTAVHSNHHVHQNQHNHEPLSPRSQNCQGSRDVDMEWD